MNIRLLHWGRSWEHTAFPRRINFGYHPYCQLEVCVRGTVVIRMPEKNCTLNAGDMCFLPAGAAHQIVYPESNEFYSLKFEASNTPDQPVHIPRSRFSTWCITSFRQCHETDARLLLPIDPDTREIIEELLGSCMKKILSSKSSVPSEPELFQKIREVTLRTGRSITVSECASLLDMDTAQLNYQFSKALKNGSSLQQESVKKIIDETLLYLINRYLDFTDFSLETIAREMEFNNVYTFSRFYKRLSGTPPGKRRKK